MQTEQTEMFSEEQQQQTDAPASDKHCLYCDAPIVGGTSRKAFCDDKCRAKYHKKHGASKQVTEETETMEKPSKQKNGNHLVATLNGIPAHAQYIIVQQEKEIERLRTELTEEKAERKKAEGKVAELKEEIKDSEHQQALQGLENAKPSLMEQVGHVLSQLPPEVTTKGMEMLSGLFKRSAPALAGFENLDDDGKKKMELIANWYSTLSNDYQAQVYALIDGLSKLPNEQALKQKLQQFAGQVKNGHAFNFNNGYYGFNQ